MAIILPTHNQDIGADWEPIAADSADFLLAVAGPGVIEVAVTAIDAEPLADVLAGYELSRLNRESLSRADVPIGFVWARAQPSGMTPSVKIALTTWAV